MKYLNSALIYNGRFNTSYIIIFELLTLGFGTVDQLTPLPQHHYCLVVGLYEY